MAIFRLSVSTISRGKGRSAVAAAAYRSGERFVDHRTALVHDYRRRAGVVASGLIGWRNGREALWQAAEAAERRRDARVAREVLVALPHELSQAAHLRLVETMASELHGQHGFAVDWNIHAPDAQGDQRNWHCHLLTTTRRSNGSELGEKARELDDKRLGPENVEKWRILWAQLCNEELARARASARVDHRSLAAQAADVGGAAELPQIKMGVGAVALERRGVLTSLGNENRRRKRVNLALRGAKRITRLLASRLRAFSILGFDLNSRQKRLFRGVDLELF